MENDPQIHIQYQHEFSALFFSCLGRTDEQMIPFLNLLIAIIWEKAQIIAQAIATFGLNIF